MAERETILSVDGLSCRFDASTPWLRKITSGGGRRYLMAVNGVSFTMKRGTTFSIVGESGCGKTTLARMVAGLQAPTWDHVVPISRGGPDSRDNMIVVCRGCNQDKADRNPVEWLGILRYLGDQRAPKVERFLEIIGAGWTDEDRAPIVERERWPWPA